MRLLFDLFPCQTGSRFRGIGRYVLSLADTMARLRGRHDMVAVANGLYPDSADALREQLGRRLPPAHFATYTHPPVGPNEGSDAAIAATLVHHAYQAIAPDVVFCSSPFEGWHEPGTPALPIGRLPSALRVGVLYDLIPCVYPEHYLNVPAVKAWYERRLEALKEFDLLLAISDATRDDAIRILGIAPERVVNIAGAASSIFRRLAPHECADTARFGISRPFVLYTGNVDYRKNMDGMLRAYAALPAPLRQAHQLVLNQVGNLDDFRRRTQALGLADDEVVVTGHISDHDLISLYNRCKVFVFPSLYEGFGLPALEAMACGAPVIAANNSSIPEVMGRSDVLFDAKDTAAITAALQHVLTDDAWRDELAAYGIERARDFSWERTATLAWQAIEQRLANRSTQPLRHHVPLARARIAVACPMLPGARATLHCQDVLPQLAEHMDIDLFVDEAALQDLAPVPGCRLLPQGELASRRVLYDTVLYQLDNHASHAAMLPLIEQSGGLAVLHDVALAEPVLALARLPGKETVLQQEVLYCHGLQGWLACLEHDGQPAGLTLNRRVIEGADRLLVLDQAQLNALQSANPGAWLPPAAVLQGEAAGDINTYRAAIEAAIDASQRHTLSNLADALEGTSPGDDQLHAIAAHAASNWRLRKQPRLLVDVTQLARSDLGSGIQRVVRNIASEILRMASPGQPVELVRQHEGKLWRAPGVVASLFGVPADSLQALEVTVQPGDTLLMIDSSWEQYADFAPVFQAVRQLGGRIVTVVYDLIPLQLPHTCIPALVRVFEHWFPLAVQHSDMLLCISGAVADEVRAYIARHQLPMPRQLEVTHWPLGADLTVRSSESAVREEVLRMLEDTANPLFLMVGTLEPRKGHAFALQAFEQLWQQGSTARLCMAGSIGWLDADTLDHIRNHPELGKRLFFIERFTDAEINLCYAAATGLIAASVAEGFGLPIVEAALHRVPALASDIPVFREVGGAGARYFSLEHPGHLAQAVTEFAAMPAEQRLAMAARIPTVTWKQSARALLDVIKVDIKPGTSGTGDTRQPD